MFYVFPITINCERGFCEIVGEKRAYSFHCDCCKEVFKSENKDECVSYAKENGLIIKDFSDVRKVSSNNDLWHDF